MGGHALGGGDEGAACTTTKGSGVEAWNSQPSMTGGSELRWKDSELAGSFKASCSSCLRAHIPVPSSKAAYTSRKDSELAGSLRRHIRVA
jgi:hypothetical protein